MAAHCAAGDVDSELVFCASIGDDEQVRRRVYDGGANVNTLVRTLVSEGAKHQSTFAGHASSPWAQVSSRGLPKKLHYDDGLSPMMAAALGGNTGTVKLLLELNALPDSLNLANETALMMAAGSGKERVVQLLLQPGEDKSGQAMRPATADLADLYGFTALHKAANCGHAEVCRILVKNGASYSARDKANMTPLLLAAAQGRVGAVTVLLESGASADSRGAEGATALAVAAAQGRTGACIALLKGGATVDLTDEYGVTPLALAAEMGHTSTVTELLRFGAELDRRVLEEQRSAFHLACFGGHRDCAAELLRAGCDKSLVDSTGQTGLGLANLTGNGQVIAEQLEEVEQERLVALSVSICQLGLCSSRCVSVQIGLKFLCCTCCAVASVGT